MFTRTSPTPGFPLCGAVLAAMLLLFMPASHAQNPIPPHELSGYDLRSEIARLKSEMEALDQSPDAPPEWKELKTAQADIERLRTVFNQDEKNLRDRMVPKMQLPQVEAWRKRVHEVQTQYYSLTHEDTRRTRIAGYELYKARHRELLALPPADTSRLRYLGFDVLTFPGIDGSTSTQPLATLIAARCFQVRCDWVEKPQQWNREPWMLYDTSSLTVSSPRDPEYDLAEFSMRAWPDEGPTRRLAPIINGLLAANASTHNAYVNLIERRSDIGLLARGPSPDELDLARKSSVELETVPIALDAFVFLVNEENPVRNLTTAQIRDIYSGVTANWKDLGGTDLPVVAYQREPNSGSQELMIALVMKGLPFKIEEKQHGAPKFITYGMGGPFVALTREKSGLAYSVYYYEHYMAGSPRTRPIAIDGIEPTFDTIQNRTYPYTTEVLAVTRKDLVPDAPAHRLRGWMLSSEGQALIRKSGYAPIAPAAK